MGVVVSHSSFFWLPRCDLVCLHQIPAGSRITKSSERYNTVELWSIINRHEPGKRNDDDLLRIYSYGFGHKREPRHFPGEPLGPRNGMRVRSHRSQTHAYEVAMRSNAFLQYSHRLWGEHCAQLSKEDQQSLGVSKELLDWIIEGSGSMTFQDWLHVRRCRVGDIFREAKFVIFF